MYEPLIDGDTTERGADGGRGSVSAGAGLTTITEALNNSQGHGDMRASGRYEPKVNGAQLPRFEFHRPKSEPGALIANNNNNNINNNNNKNDGGDKDKSEKDGKQKDTLEKVSGRVWTVSPEMLLC